MSKKIIPVTLAVILLLTGFASARVEQMTYNGIRIPSDVSPMVIDGWFMVPLSAVGRHIGADVFWDADARCVKVQYLNNDINVRIGDDSASVNGQERRMHVPATIIRGRTMVTARFMADCIDATVDWDYHSTTIIFKQ